MWESGKKWFTQMRSINHFKSEEGYFYVSTKQFKLTNTLRRAKHFKMN